MVKDCPVAAAAAAGKGKEDETAIPTGASVIAKEKGDMEGDGGDGGKAGRGDGKAVEKGGEKERGARTPPAKPPARHGGDDLDDNFAIETIPVGKSTSGGGKGRAGAGGGQAFYRNKAVSKHKQMKAKGKGKGRV